MLGLLRGNRLQQLHLASITDDGVQSLHHKDKQQGGQRVSLMQSPMMLYVFSRLTIDKNPCGGGG
jgi:hypothetical protein